MTTIELEMDEAILDALRGDIQRGHFIILSVAISQQLLKIASL